MKTRLINGRLLTVERLMGPGKFHFTTHSETMFYPLVGSAMFRLHTGNHPFKCTVDVRDKIFQSTIRDPGKVEFIRLPVMKEGGSITVTPEKYIDWLMITYTPAPSKQSANASTQPDRHGFASLDIIGENTYRRSVRHAVKPNGFMIDAGETRNWPGQWSSWPAHANQEDMVKFANGETDWEEVFFCVTAPVYPTIPNSEVYALMYTNGYNVDRKPDYGVRLIRNGDCFRTPLGSHPVIASPVTKLFYVWIYAGDALAKEYNRAATHTGTYVK